MPRRGRKHKKQKRPPRVFEPPPGSTVLTCGHECDENRKTWHFWLARPKPVSFRRPDGSTGEARYFAACDPCFRKVGGQLDRVEIRNDIVWQLPKSVDDLVELMVDTGIEDEAILGENPGPGADPDPTT